MAACKSEKRAGFTLVELLILVIIIGVLASAMILLSGSGQDRAEASRIITDLRNLVGAAQMFFTDHPDEQRLGPTDPPANEIARLQPYMDRELEENFFVSPDPSVKCYFFIRTYVGTAYVGCVVVLGSFGTAMGGSIEGAAKILAGERDELGLLEFGPSTPGISKIFVDPNYRLPKYNGSMGVAMKAR